MPIQIGECVNALQKPPHTLSGAVVLDPHGELINDVLTRIPDRRRNDIIYLNLLDNPDPFGLNLFEHPNSNSQKEIDLKVAQIQHTFEVIWGATTADTPRLSEVLRNVSVTLIEAGLTMYEFPAVLQDSAFRANVLRKVTNQKVLSFWQRYSNLKPSEQYQYTESTLNKIDSFLTSGLTSLIVAQLKSTINVEEIMQKQKILLVVLSPRLSDVTTLIGCTIIGLLLNGAYARSDLPPAMRKLFCVYVDEAQRFGSTDLKTLLVESRKFNIATVLANQTLSQLSDEMRGAVFNCENKIVFRITGEDAPLVASNMDVTPTASEPVREEVIIPKFDVVEHLLNFGHEDNFVRLFVKTYLAPLSLGAKQHPEPHGDIEGLNGRTALVFPSADYSDGTTYRYIPKLVQEGLLLLNKILYDAVCGRVPKSSSDGPQIKKAISFFDYILGVPHYFQGDIQHSFVRLEKTFEDDLVANASRLVFGMRLDGKLEKWPKEKVPFSLGADRVFTRLRMQKTGDLVFHKMVQYPELFLFWYQPFFDMPKLEKDQFVSGAGWVSQYDYSKVYETAHKIITREKDRYFDFTSVLLLTLEGLAAMPIYKGSGRWVMKEGVKQTYSDMLNQVANELTMLPRYTAKVRTASEEYTATTLPLPEAEFELAETLDLVRANNLRDGYTRSAAEVLQEIADRVNELSPKLTPKQQVK